MAVRYDQELARAAQIEAMRRHAEALARAGVVDYVVVAPHLADDHVPAAYPNGESVRVA